MYRVFYRVIQTQVEVWENEKCCGNTSRRRVFSTAFFQFSQTLTSVCITRYLLEKHHDEKKEKQLVNFGYQKCKFSLLAPSLRQQRAASSVSISSYTNAILNQSARVLS